MRDTRAELLNQAEILVRGRGYSGFSYADLAAAVGIRKASIHHHFPSKVDLAVALLASYRQRYDVGLAAIVASTDDALARVTAYAQFYLQGVERSLGCLCAALAAELDTLPVQLRRDLAAFFDAHIAWLENVLRDGQANGTVRAQVEPAAFARMIVAALEGALMMERVAGGTTGFGDTLSAIAQSLAPEERIAN